MKPSLQDLFARTKLYSPIDRYVIIILRRDTQLGNLLQSLEAFSCVTYEEDEVSLVLTQDLWTRYSSSHEGAKVAGPYRLITFDLELDLDVCGYFAAISRLLSGAGVSMIPISTFLRDHILVREADYEKAIGTLDRFLRDQR